MSGSARSTQRPVTPAQARFIANLLRDAGEPGLDTLAYHGGTRDRDGNLTGLTGGWGGTASRLIEDLKSGNYRDPRPAAGTGTRVAPPLPTARTNGNVVPINGRTPAGGHHGATSPAGARFRANAPSAARWTPTAEQNVIVEMFKTPDDQGRYQSMKIFAGAGAGKTSTLKLCAEATPARRGLYVAFNKAIVVAGDRSFPKRLPQGGGIEARTMHSLAYRGTDQVFIDRMKRSRRVHPDKIASTLGITPIAVQVPQPDGSTRRKVLQAGYLASLVMAAISRFCQSADEIPSKKHFARQEGLDPDDVWDNHNALAKALERHLEPVWADLCKSDGWAPYKPEHYLKSWCLSHPIIPHDYLLVDEGQDLSPVMRGFVEDQLAAGKQVVVVGDTFQEINCQPVGTMVRVPRRSGEGRGKTEPMYQWDEVPIESLKVGDRVVSYDLPKYRFRVGGSPITKISTVPYEGDLITVKTPDGVSSRYTPDHHCVVNVGDAFPHHVVYLMRRGNQYRVGQTEWQKRNQGKLNGPGARTKAEGGDAFWILSAHDTKAEALLAEAVVAHRFNIPTWCFNASNHLTPLHEFWSHVGDNSENANRCLTAFGRRLDSPLWTAGDHTWFARRPVVTRACNLMDGMRLLPMDNVPYVPKRGSWNTHRDAWVPITVTRSPYVGSIVSMTVADDHTYVGDGLVTHNSWMGAVNALESLPIVNEAKLTKSFRFGPTVAELANRILAHIGTDFRIEGNEAVESTVGRATGPVRCTLSRSNAVAVAGYMDHRREGGRPHLVGQVDDIIWFCQFARVLQITEERESCQSRLSLPGLGAEARVEIEATLQQLNVEWDSEDLDGVRPHPELACFSAWQEVRLFVAEHEDGKEIKLLVKLVEDFRAMEIVHALKDMTDEERCTHVYATAHKMKGREFDSVELAVDFPDEIEKCDEAEAKLLYVAVTRAKLHLDPSGAGCLAEMCVGLAA